ncbi:MAG: aldo/keto reductase [Xanthobacteraceae bacterium]
MADGSMSNEFVEIHGARVPAIGLGTWDLRGRTCARVVEQALRLGYRHVDTAEMYDNEREIGEALRASGVKRQDVFITTKIWPSHLAPLELERAAKESLARLRLTEVDLLLIHWPNPKIPLSETIPALCKMKQAGFTRHVGVSNFTVALIDEAVGHATEPLVTNQIEWHPFLDQSKVRAACAAHGIAVTAYSPIARGKAAGDKELKLIGLHHRKSAAQVCLRYLLQEGAIVIPRTSKVERLSENLNVLDFELDDAEMDEIRKLASSGGRMVTMGGAPEWD